MTTTDTAVPKPRTSKEERQEEANRLARRRLREAHARPRENLAVEGWIPVLLRDGRLDQVGLADVLAKAHLIRDIAEPHPLVRASVRRLLGGLAVEVVRRAGLDGDDWIDRVDDNTGFPPEAVLSTVAVHADHWWLWHPTTPFLQDIRLIDTLTKPGDFVRVQEIIPDLPSRSTATWFVKPGEPASTMAVTASDTARWLLARWFYGLPGNCADITLRPGTTVGSHWGGTFTESVATVTHAWRVSGHSLFTTLLRNIPATMLTGSGATAGCAWLDGRRPAGGRHDPLYLATVPCSATLLAASDEHGNITHVVKGPLPHDKLDVKDVQRLAVDADAHRIVAEKNTNRARTPVRLDPAQRVEALRQFYRDGVDAATLRGVVNSADLWLPALPPHATAGEQVDMLLAKKNGTGSSPGWEDVVTFGLPAAYLDGEHPHFAAVRSAVAYAFDPRTGIWRELEYAARDLLAPARPGDNAVKGLVRAVQQRWLAQATDLLTRALDDRVTADEDWRWKLRREACAAFRDVFAPYATSTRYAAPYAIALSRLANPRRSA